MLKHEKQSIVRCSFCGKTQSEVKKIIAGPSGVYICDECVELCNDILGDSPIESDFFREGFSLPTPEELRQKLDEYIVGQDNAKKTLAVAVYNHYKRISVVGRNEVELQKSNILLLGPTGVGKTYLAQTLAKILNVPFAIADATALTEAGYVGEDVEHILFRLIQAADHDIPRAEHGIIYVDEIDKIARRGDNASITRDVSGEGVQQALLKILEGTVASVPPHGGRKHPHQEFLQINTGNILFICGGSFSGIETIIEQRLNKKVIGFGTELPSKSKSHETMNDVTPQDLAKYGFIQELIGRLPVIVNLDPLDEETLITILTQPKNSLIKQYKRLLEMDNVTLEFTKEALQAIAKEASAQSTGARGLRTIIENFMRDIMYQIPSRADIEKVTITRETVMDKEEPQIIYNPDRPVLQKLHSSESKVS